MSQLANFEILFVSHKYPPATGGMEKQSFELIHGMEKHAKVHYLVYQKAEGNILKFFFSLNKRILALLKLHPSIQIIHFNDGLLASLALFHKGYEHLKRTATLHGLDLVFPLPYFQRRILPRFNQYDLLIAVSNATARAAIERGINKNKLCVIPNGVDHQMAYQPPLALSELYSLYPQVNPHKKYLICLGRPVLRKGFSWFLKNVAQQLPDDFQVLLLGPFDIKPTLKERILYSLPKNIRNLIMLFLGYPSDQRAIRKLIKSPSLQNKAVHLGKVPFLHLHSFLAHATAFLMPNIPVNGDMEGFGLVCLEASISGSLVLAADLDGITDAIKHQQNGILLPAANDHAWLQQLNEVLQKPEAFARQAQKFQTFSLQHYSWEKMCQGYARAFYLLLNPNPQIGKMQYNFSFSFFEN